MSRRALFLWGLVFLISPLGAEPLVWFDFDLPPLHILSGPQKGQGQLDGVMQFMISHLKGYETKIVGANITRIIKTLQGTRLGIAAGFQRNPEREKTLTFSAPFMAALAPTFVINKKDEAKLLPYLNFKHEVDLARWIKTESLGVVAGRSYTAFIDAILMKADGRLTQRYAADQIALGVLKMVSSNHVTSAIVYHSELQHFQTNFPHEYSQLLVFPIAGLGKFIPVYFISNPTPQGRALIHQVNQILKDHWNDAELRKSTMAGVADPQLAQEFIQEGYQGP